MRIANVADFREAARRRLPRMLFDYIDGGAYDEATLERNVYDFREIRLRQRVLRDVSQLHTATRWLGQDMSMPVGLGPVGFSGMYARRGEAQAARAAAAAGVSYCLSTLSICDVAETARASARPIWFQFYAVKDRGFAKAVLERAKASGVTTLAFTVDLPVTGARCRDVRSGMSAPPGVGAWAQRLWQGMTHLPWVWDVQARGQPLIFGNLKGAVENAKGAGAFSAWVTENLDASLTWRDLDWVRSEWSGQVLLKGVLDPEDARSAMLCGCDGVIVSNHGGRQLDGAPSSISALPAVVAAVDGRGLVLMDGGVRSGLDVLRALALGADGCLLGRAWAYALAARGEKGVAEMLEIVRAELKVAMALTGCTDIRGASRDLLA